MSTKTNADQLQIPDNLNVSAVCDNVIVAPVNRPSKPTEHIELPARSQQKSWNHLQYGVVVDWGSHIPETYHNREDRDYDKAKQSLWSLDKQATRCQSVVSFGQKRSQVLSLEWDIPLGVVKVQNIFWVEPYDEEVFDLATYSEFYD